MSDSRRTAIASVCVPIASARYTIPGTKNATAIVELRVDSKAAIAAVASALPASPTRSQGSRWRTGAAAVLDRVACLRRFAFNAGKPVQVLDVLAAQHLQQRLRRHYAERAALRIHHRQRVHAVVERERGGALLVRVGGNAGKRR